MLNIHCPHTNIDIVFKTTLIAMLDMTDTEAAFQEKKRTVLIAMDGSKHAINAFEWFVENAYRESDTVIMAHCAEIGTNLPPTALLTANPAVIQKIVQEHEDEVMKVFKISDQLANKHNVKHKLERLNGEPGEAIVKTAELQNADIIVIGSRGLGVVRRTIMGSVSDYVIHHAHVPVLVCKHVDNHSNLKQK